MAGVVVGRIDVGIAGRYCHVDPVALCRCDTEIGGDFLLGAVSPCLEVAEGSIFELEGPKKRAIRTTSLMFEKA